ncbi:MAG: PAS domain S-box protein [Desulfomonilia bacterium]|jgi:PAS domain S-box-containing protein
MKQPDEYRHESLEYAGRGPALTGEAAEVLARNLRIGYAVIAEDRTIIQANPVLKQIFGSLEGRKCHQAFQLKPQPCPWCRLSHTIDSGMPQHSPDLTATDPSGNSCRFRTGFFPVDVQNGRYALKVFTPALKLTNVLTGLKKSWLPLPDVFDFLPDPAFVTDTSGAIILWNRALEEFLGIPRGSMLGKDGSENATLLYQAIQPSLADLVLGRKADAQQTYPDLKRVGDSLIAEVCLQTPQGERFVQAKAGPVRDAAGRVIGAIETIRDITDARLTREEIRLREEKYRDIFENVSDLLYVHDLNGRFLESNLPFKTDYGYTKEDLKTLTIRDLIPEELREDFRNYLARILGSGKDEGSLCITTKSGDLRILEYKNSLIRDGSGNPVSVRGSVRDITERIHALKAQRRSEELYRLLTENMHDVIWVIDTSLNYLYISPSVERLRGYTVQEAMNQSLKQFVTPESYRRIMAALAEELERERKGEKTDPYRSRSVEVEIIRKDGSKIWCEVTASFLRDETGAATRILGCTRDITARRKAEESLRESEERFRTMAQASHVVFWMSEPWPKGQPIYISPSFERIFGYSHEELHRNPTIWFDHIHPEDQARVNEIVRGKGNQAHDYECRVIRPDGTLRWVRIRVTPDGSPVMITGITEDITEQKRSEQEKASYEERLARAQKMEAIGTLAGGIAHDFNNILSAIIGYTELALDDVPQESLTARRLREVLRAGDRARDLVSQILTFSRQARTEKKRVSAHIIIKEAMKLLRSSIPSTIAIVQDIDPGCPAVFADPIQIHQVVMNLCTNAYQAMSERGGTLTVSLGPVELDGDPARSIPPLDAGRYLRLSVSDTGCGMDPETIRRIFEPFFTTKEPGKGTGMGLATVHGIISDLSGAITVESAPGRGSTFHVFLPALEGQAAEAGKGENLLPLGRGERILLVDDEPAILSFARGMIEQLGYSVLAFRSSTEALSVFNQSPGTFDLVITDQTMPQLTGSELASELLAIRGDIPIVLMSGYSREASSLRPGQQGISVYLEKPFSRRDLAHAISRALGRE